MKKISLSLAVLSDLKAGESVSLTGTIYTARDAAHKRISEFLKDKKPLPVDLAGKLIYFCGPSPAPEGKVIGSCGPTTSDRMEAYLDMMFSEVKVGGFIGKGGFSEAANPVFQKYNAPYFAATGGVGALLAAKVKSAKVVAFEDLGPEAIHALEIEDFPVTVAIDAQGNSLFHGK